VHQRQAQLDQAKVDLARTAIRSPVDGIVIARSIDAGQTVAASLQAPTLFTIAQDLRAMQVETSIDEAEIGRIRSDQDATFTVDSFPGRTFRGKVTQVRKAPQVVQNVVTYIAVISADNADLALVPGMTANVRVIVDQREGVLKVPNAALRFRPAGADAPKDEAAKAEGPTKGGAEAQQALRERLVKELKLDAEQQSRLDAIFADQREKMQALRDVGEADRRKQFERVRGESRAKIAEMLNPEQRALYQEIVASQSGRSATRGRVWTLADGKPAGVAVRLGITDGTFTELVSGDLTEGAEVIIGVADTSKGAPRTSASGPRFGF
jgi:HlyD family secretion protein